MKIAMCVRAQGYRCLSAFSAIRFNDVKIVNKMPIYDKCILQSAQGNAYTVRNYVRTNDCNFGEWFVKYVICKMYAFFFLSNESRSEKQFSARKSTIGQNVALNSTLKSNLFGHICGMIPHKVSDSGQRHHNFNKSISFCVFRWIWYISIVYHSPKRILIYKNWVNTFDFPGQSSIFGISYFLLSEGFAVEIVENTSLVWFICFTILLPFSVHSLEHLFFSSVWLYLIAYYYYFFDDGNGF